MPQNRESVYSVKMDDRGIARRTSDLKGRGGVCTRDMNVTTGARCILGRICILGLEVLGVSPRPNMYPGTNGTEMYPVTRCILQLRSIARPRCIPKDVTP